MVRRDRRGFEAMLRATYPTLKEVAIAAIVKAELQANPPRTPGYVVHIYGRDILSGDPTTIPAWRWMARINQADIVDPATGIARSVADRERALDPDCIPDQTYVWREENGWMQDVSDADAGRIRASQAVLWFRRYDDVGFYVPTDPWSLPVTEHHEFASVGDYQDFRKDDRRRPQWTGR
ncbi:MAG: hypothetical protein WBA46_04625 [Thermomicrobiales bacterium]